MNSTYLPSACKAAVDVHRLRCHASVCRVGPVVCPVAVALVHRIGSLGTEDPGEPVVLIGLPAGGVMGLPLLFN